MDPSFNDEKSVYASRDALEDVSPGHKQLSVFKRATDILSRWGVETNGIAPIPPMGRTDTRLYQLFFVWFSANLNILGFGTGCAGPAFFGLNLRQSMIILLVVDSIACIIPAYFAVFGPKLGMRSMVQARYSWGYYPAMLPAALTAFSMMAYLIPNCIIGGQVLAAVSDHIDDTLGIVITGLLSLSVAFCGYRVIHYFETYAWIPNVILFIVMLSVGGKHLVNAPTAIPIPPSAIISFATTIASSDVSWCNMTPDYGVYHSAKASSWKIFWYTYAGLFIGSFIAHILGAAFGASAFQYVPWAAGFDSGNNVGGLTIAVVAPVGGFGKFLTVVVALSIPSSNAPIMYTFGSSFMAISSWFAKVPRYVYAVISAAICVPVSIIGANNLYATFVDIMNGIGYWSTVFAGVVLSEHFIFRRNDFVLYHLDAWNKPRLLPVGVAALMAFLCTFGLIIPCMSQTWFVGPIANKGTGDIGVIVGFLLAVVLYTVLRSVEKVVFKR